MSERDERTGWHGGPVNATDEGEGVSEYSGLLEERYRRVLRLLPAPYRAEREEEMVDAFLEGSGGLTDADDPRPRWSEVASVAALAVRVRLGGGGAGPRQLVRGEAVRLTAVLGLAFFAIRSCDWLIDLLRSYGVFGTPPAVPISPGDPGTAERVRDIVGLFGALLPIAALVALVRGRPRVAKVTALLTAVLAPLSAALSYDPGLQAPDALFWDVFARSTAPHLLLLLVPVLALLSGFHRDAPRTPSWRPVLWALPAAAVLNLAFNALGPIALAAQTDFEVWSWIWPWWGEPGLACLALLVTSLIRAVMWLVGGAGRNPAWPLALAILSVPVALIRLLDLVTGPDPATATMVAVDIGQLAAVALCGLVSAVLAVRSMPAPPPAAVTSPPESAA
ncbi:hypothetical protein [Streptosporangium pseudovulgare]|uniref:DUF2029 domain-containing protein n=1 Tax=Streptosporangium pseudovulgare TaxID=35765 RepID=A0ABQ2QUM5_9ACTN|nr:hypothetical protein [Streptosporangium pseudovulgare]GGP94703.1 hypothetical protein GCM10010140_25650 [Streptosporangium pseudovulgare]